MKKTEGLYRAFPEIEAPSGLLQTVLHRIEVARRRNAQLRAGMFGLLVLACAGALVPVVQYTVSQFYTSGFYDFLSLGLSDHSLLLTYWREFGLTLLESLPSLALLLLLPLAITFTWSLRRLVKNARNGFTYA